MMTKMHSLNLIGRREFVNFPLLNIEQLVAKIDTGAYTCAIHCKQIDLKIIEKKERYSKREFVKFVITSGLGLLINVGGVRFITKVLLLSPVWGLAPTFVTPFITFLISKFWAFRVKKPVVKALHK